MLEAFVLRRCHWHWSVVCDAGLHATEGNGTSDLLSELVFLLQVSVEREQGVRELRQLKWAERHHF